MLSFHFISLYSIFRSPKGSGGFGTSVCSSYNLIVSVVFTEEILDCATAELNLPQSEGTGWQSSYQIEIMYTI